MFPVWKHKFASQKLMFSDRKHKFSARKQNLFKVEKKI